MLSLFSKGELAPLLDLEGSNNEGSTSHADDNRHTSTSHADEDRSTRTSRAFNQRRSRTSQDDEDDESERREMLMSLFLQPVPSRRARPANAKWNAKAVRPTRPEYLFTASNITYVCIAGWWLGLGYLVASLVLYLSVVGRRYGWHCLRMARYVFWPFGCYLARVPCENVEVSSVGSKVGFYIWGGTVAPCIGLLHLIASLMFWVLTPFIPMSKINIVCAYLLYDSPLSVKLGGGGPPVQHEVLLCVYSAASMYYFRYSVGGVNVVFFNLLLLAPVTIGISYGLGHHFLEENSAVVMVMALLSIIPLANLIGVAICSISAKTSFAFGAILNATFGSTIEIFIFLFTMPKISNAALFVRKALMGSMLADLLLMSSLPMIVGGMKLKEQKFNRQAAGISSVLLIVAITGVFAPTIFYLLYGNPTIFIVQTFSLKTHSYLVEKKQDLDEEGGLAAEGEESPEWSMSRSIATLTVCTGMVACLAETLSEVLQLALDDIGIPAAFAGLTVIAWTPALCEYINAVVFALQNNISLSLSIATSSALQVGMIQLPLLIWMQQLLPYTGFWPEHVFQPVFGILDIIALFMAVLLTNYLSNDGRSNYLEGAALLTVYVIIIAINYCSAQLEKVSSSQ